MAHKIYLLNNYENFIKVKNIILNKDQNYFAIHVINEKPIDYDTISIVMTACDRSVQTYHTLKTISRSKYKNVQIVLVDDSQKDPINVEHLKTFDLHIELINIKNKCWINPCVNYNIGFLYAKGQKIIIQNAEVCHIGDVLSHIYDNLKDDQYMVFNVFSLDRPDVNNILYSIDSLSNFEKSNLLNALIKVPSNSYINTNGRWYHHGIIRQLYYNFLCAITRNTLDLIGGFDIDYSFGMEYDDVALVFILPIFGIKIINAPEHLIGIHQWHTQTAVGSFSGKFHNRPIYIGKSNYFVKNKKYVQFTEYNKDEYNKIINEWF